MATAADRARNGSKRKRDVAALEAEDGPLATREGRLTWAAEHFPDFGDRVVLHAMAMAERRPAGGISVDTVRVELDRMNAVPLMDPPAEEPV